MVSAESAAMFRKQKITNTTGYKLFMLKLKKRKRNKIFIIINASGQKYF